MSDFAVSHWETADWCVKQESWCWCWRTPIKQWGALGRRAVYKLCSFIQASSSPCGATSPVPCHLYANKFSPIPYWFQGHKINMCCFTSADKKQNVAFCHSCTNVGSLFSVTQELIKLDSRWMLSPSGCLCKQLAETDHFNGRLWLQLISRTRSANSLFHCFLLWFHFRIYTFLTTWQLSHFFDTKEPAISAGGKQQCCRLI